MNYENEPYWKTRGKGYLGEFASHSRKTKEVFAYQEERIIAELDKLKFESVLEAGCGFGRITKLISERYNPKRYDAFDISEEQISNARKLNLDVSFETKSVFNFRYENEYDLVITSELLMHIPFTDIKSVIRKLLLSSKHYMVNIDWFTYKRCNIDHCYSHNYKKYYLDAGCQVRAVHLNNSLFDRIMYHKPKLEQSIFIAEKLR